MHDVCCATGVERSCCGRECRSCRYDVVDENDRAIANVSDHLECPVHIRGAVTRRQRALRGRVTNAAQRGHRRCNPRMAACMYREEPRLIKTAPPPASPMQRNRDDDRITLHLEQGRPHRCERARDMRGAGELEPANR